MRNIFAALLLLFTTTCWSDTKLPMASFLIKIGSPQESKAAWNKVRVHMLSKGYAFSKNISVNSKLFSYPNAEEKISVIITENSSKGFIEVVFLQERDEGFSDFAGSKFHQLKSGIKEDIINREMVDGVSFVSGTKKN